MNLTSTVEEIIDEYQEEIEELKELVELDSNYEYLVGYDPEVSLRLMHNRKRIIDLELWVCCVKKTK